MLWILILLTFGLFAVWSGVESRDRSEVSEQELPAQNGMSWEQSDPLAYVAATELAAARLVGRSYTMPPVRDTSHRFHPRIRSFIDRA